MTFPGHAVESHFFCIETRDCMCMTSISQIKNINYIITGHNLRGFEYPRDNQNNYK